MASTNRWLCGLLSLCVLACSSEDEDSADSGGDITFAEPGSLSEASGKGSFRFGAASAATQIEDQNENTDWYVFTQPKADGGLGQGHAFVGDAAGGYTRAIDDIALLETMQLDSYRFSIEWARVEPQRDVIDEQALEHYSQLIDALLAKGIKPVITLHHFSNPIWVADPRDPDCAKGPSDTNLCGFGHPQGGPQIVEELAEHAKLLGERFGDRVDEWGTVNEPVNYLLAGYGVGFFPPGKSSILSASALLGTFVPVVRDYVHGHAAMYKALKEADQIDADGDGQPASVGLTLSVADWVPARINEPSDDPEDIAARDRLINIYHYLFVDALREGMFDADLDGTLEEPQADWKGTIDWLGVQYYFRAGVTGLNGLVPVLNLTPCFSGFDFGACVAPKDPTFCVPAMGYEYYAPGLYTVLSDYSKRWPDLPLVVSESGIATEVGERRAENVVRALEQIERARREGADVRGYYHWSLFDNFEWAEGFGPRFGLYQVDYATFERTPTLGAEVLGEIAGKRRLERAVRKQYGGEGPMTPEAEPLPGLSCSG